MRERYNYDPWGRRRNPADWSYSNVPTSFFIDRGFTGHEHLDQFGLINMNGRVYDPLIAMFLSPDNNVQASDFTQNFNRYTYCFNNPLIYTDPSGMYAYPTEFMSSMGGGLGSDPTSKYDYTDFYSYSQGYYQWQIAPHIAAWNPYIYDQVYNTYRNSMGQQVPFNEVYSNYMIPNSTNFYTYSSNTYLTMYSGTSGNWAFNVAPVSLFQTFSSGIIGTSLEATLAGYTKSVGLAGGYSVSSVLSGHGGYSIEMSRFTESPDATLSRFTANGPNSKSLSGYILEPGGPSTTKSGLDRRIPAGTYNMRPYHSPSLNQDVYILSNSQVSEGRGILIHIGNYPSNTLDCLLPGSSYSMYNGNYAVWNSTTTFNSLSLLLGTNKATVTITDINP